MPDNETNAVAPNGATVINTEETTVTQPTENGASITTNVITGKRADGSELVELNLKPDKAHAFVERDMNKHAGEETHKHTKVHDLPSGGKVFPPIKDGAKIFYFYEGYYLDLTNFLTFDDLDPNQTVTKDFLSTWYTPLEVFKASLDKFVSIDSYRAKFSEYYTIADMDAIVKRVEDKLAKLPNDAYSKHEVNQLLGNIDSYSREEVNEKLADIFSTIIRNNNNWYRSIKELATINFVKDTLANYISKKELEDAKVGISAHIAAVANRIDNIYTKQEVDQLNSDKITETALREYTKDLINSRALESAISNFLTNDTFNNTIKNYVKTTELNNRLNVYATTSDVDLKLLNKVDKTTLQTNLDDINSAIDTINTKATNYVTNSQLITTLEPYTKNDSVDNKITSVRQLFSNYQTILETDNKLEELKAQVHRELASYMTIEAYNTDKSNFVTRLALQTTKDELLTAMRDKISKDYVDTEIEAVKNQFKTNILQTITEEEVDNKLLGILNTLSTMYTKQEINVIKSGLETNIADLRTYSDNTYMTKKDGNKALAEKANITYVDQQIAQVKTDIDVDGKIANLVDNTMLTSVLNDYPTKVLVNSLLANKASTSDLDTLKTEISNTTDSKLSAIRDSISITNTGVSTLENNMNKKIQELSSTEAVNNNRLEQLINQANERFDEYEKADSLNSKINAVKDSLENQVTVLSNSIDPKINIQTRAILELSEKIDTKVTQLEIDTAKSEVLDKLTEEKNKLAISISGVDAKLAGYVTNDTYNTEKVKFATKNQLDALETTVNNNKLSASAVMAANGTAIDKLKADKLDKSVYEEYIKNVYTKTELASKLITFDDVFRKSEVSDLITNLNTEITKNKDKITNLTTTVDTRYTNKNIDDKITESYNKLNKSVINAVDKLDSKVEKSKYNTDLAAIDGKINDRPTYNELISSINNNNKKFKTGDEIITTLETFRTNFWNDILANYSTTADMNNKLDTYTTLTKLHEELSNYTTLEALNNKILEINGVSRADVVSMINDANIDVTNAIKLWANEILKTYVTLQVFNDALDDKVDVASYEVRVKHIEDNYLAKAQYETDKAHFITDTNISSIINSELLTFMSSYYNKTEVDNLLNSIKNLIISNSNLFYSKDIMDDKLELLETKSEATTKNTDLNDKIDELRGRFNDYPRIVDMEARLNAITAYGSGISLDSFYSKSNVDTLLNKKVDLDTFNTFRNKVYTIHDIDTKCNDYVLKSNYTTDINSIRDDIHTIKANPIMNVSGTVVTDSYLTTVLNGYAKNDTLALNVSDTINAELGKYLKKSELTAQLNGFKLTLSDLDNLTNYVTKASFNDWKTNQYDKVYIDNIKNKFDEYTNTNVLNSKLDEIKSTIKTDQQIIELAQSQGGRNYTREEIDTKLSDKLDLVTVNNLLTVKEGQFDTKYALANDLVNNYVSKTSFDNTVSQYLHLENGGTVVGPTKFTHELIVTDGLVVNDINLANGDIRNVKDLTVTGNSFLTTVQSTNVTTQGMDVSNNLNVKNVIVNNTGKLTLPQTKLKSTETFDNAPLSSYGNIAGNLSLIVQDSNPEFVYSIGFRTGNTLTAKMIKFNNDGSISTRNAKDSSFEGNWTPLALRSEITTLSDSIANTYVSKDKLATTLNSYQLKSDFTDRLNDFYGKRDIDLRFKSLSDIVDKLDIRTYVDRELSKRVLGSDFDDLRTEMNTGLSNRFTKDELNKIWKVQLMNDITAKLDEGWVNKADLANTLTSYVNMATLTPMMTQQGIDIMNNISTEYIKLSGLNDKLKSYYLKSEMDSKLLLYTSKEDLKTVLTAYTTTEDMNEIHEGMNTQIKIATKTANTAKSDLDAFKDVVSTQYYNKDDTEVEMDKMMTRKMKPYALITYVDEQITNVNDTITTTKAGLESSINITKTNLEHKDAEQDTILEAHTNKFNDYTLTTTHTKSVTDERNISDGKYATKTELALHTKKTYVDTELNKKANLTGATFTGPVTVPTLTNTNANITTANVTTNIVNKLQLKDRVLVENESATNLGIVDKNVIVPSYNANNAGLLIGNKSTKEATEPVGFNLGWTGSKLTYQNLTNENNFYKPSGKVYNIASEDWVTSAIAALKSGEMSTKINDVTAKINRELNTNDLTQPTFAKWVNDKIEAVKTDTTNANYVRTTTYQADKSALDAKLTDYDARIKKNKSDIGVTNTNLTTLDGKHTALSQTVNNIKTHDLPDLETKLKKYVDDKIGEISAVLNKIVGV